MWQERIKQKRLDWFYTIVKWMRIHLHTLDHDHHDVGKIPKKNRKCLASSSCEQTARKPSTWQWFMEKWAIHRNRHQELFSWCTVVTCFNKTKVWWGKEAWLGSCLKSLHTFLVGFRVTCIAEAWYSLMVSLQTLSVLAFCSQRPASKKADCILCCRSR